MITIQNNKRQRRILIFDSAFNLEDSNDFLREMFDAVFVFTSSPDEAKAILNVINPVTSRKCCYKPFLLSRDLKGQLDEYDELVDCYTYDIDDAETLDTVEEIITHIESIDLQPDDNDVLSGNLFFVRLYRYLISRRVYNLTPELNHLSAMGYSIPLFELFYRQGAYSLNEYIIFNQSMVEKGYIRPVQFINKIYLCPKCLHSHLLYIENCPHCHSSDIKSEEVIHHFRCANISPEHTYNFGGQLRCPKCHQLLRHIGVDYDRPSVVYTCSNCEETFVQPSMSAVCTTCGNRSDVTGLTPYDVTAFEVTPEGCKAIVSPNIGFTVYTDFYDNYMEFDRFMARLRLLSNLKSAGSTDADIVVVKVWVLNSQEESCPLNPDFISLLCKRFPTHKVSSANNMVYIRNSVYASDNEENIPSDELTARLDVVLSKAATTIAPDERICYAVSRYEGDMEEFTNNLYFTSPFPKRTFPYRQAEEETPQEAKASIGAMPEDAVPESPSPVEPVAYPADETEHAGFAEPVDEEPADGENKKDTPRSNGSSLLRGVVILLAIGAVVALLSFLWYTPEMEEEEPYLLIGEAEEIMSADTALAETPVERTDSAMWTEETEELQLEAPEEPQAVETEATAAEPVLEETRKGMYYVVEGAFTWRENAEWQLHKNAEARPGYAYRLYKHGSFYVVSPYCSTDPAQCEAFVRNEGLDKVWIAQGKRKEDGL